MSTRDEELYQQVILDHNKNPRNFKALEPRTHEAEGYNPLCGDHLHVHLRVNGQGVVEEAAFLGEGCAISKASASMMTAALKGRTVGEVKALFEEFRRLLIRELDPAKDPHHLGKLTVFAGVWKYPSRVKCAGLAWHTLTAALEKKATVSTE